MTVTDDCVDGDVGGVAGEPEAARGELYRIFESADDGVTMEAVSEGGSFGSSLFDFYATSGRDADRVFSVFEAGFDSGSQRAKFVGLLRQICGDVFWVFLMAFLLSMSAVFVAAAFSAARWLVF